jgi:hypothetical protein
MSYHLMQVIIHKNKVLNVLFSVKWQKKVMQNEHLCYDNGLVWDGLFGWFTRNVIMVIYRIFIALGWRKRRVPRKTR